MKASAIGHGRSHPNIAVVKYWGKADAINNMPSTPSISFPLTRFLTETFVEHSAEDVFHLDGQKVPVTEKMHRVIEVFRKRAGDNAPVSIRSSSNFPHSCGLASSASGFAALVLALDDFYGLALPEEELCAIARLGSGSAGRSTSTGIHLFDGTSIRKLPPWKEIRILSIILSPSPKDVPSTEGMARTESTSNFYRERLARAEAKIKAMVQCISQKDFDTFAEMTMRESNELHGILMETYPPIRYICDKGFQVIQMCHKLNVGGTKAAYTFDAGPNPFLITLEHYLDEVRAFFKAYTLVPSNY